MSSETFDPNKEISNAVSDILDNKSFDIFFASETRDPKYWQNYISSYGQSIGEFNLGAARAMQQEITLTNTTCFQKAIIASNSIAHIFSLDMYENNFFNIADFVNLMQQFYVKYLD